jgi:regulator of RNase E activity RraA
VEVPVLLIDDAVRAELRSGDVIEADLQGVVRVERTL